ncbi:MAG: 4'-phosphopantetheinyl transferase superfamily protein, partial [Clostridiales Family XIII bacterium]|nr:4'-phosphopantetheinyl transferase superfamily protein [Clostridiales Family XIII bacterium]
MDMRVYVCEFGKGMDSRSLLGAAFRSYAAAAGIVPAPAPDAPGQAGTPAPAPDAPGRDGTPAPDAPGCPEIAFGQYGKPFFAQFPHIKFSVSHSGGLWACLMCGFEVGLDIEDTRQRAERAGFDWLGIARRFFAQDECGYVEGGGRPEEALSRFFEIWTKKEAYVKYTGRGIGGGLRGFSVLSGCAGAAFGML